MTGDDQPRWQWGPDREAHLQPGQQTSSMSRPGVDSLQRAGQSAGSPVTERDGTDELKDVGDSNGKNSGGGGGGRLAATLGSSLSARGSWAGAPALAGKGQSASRGAPTPSATSHLEHASTLLGLNRRQPSSPPQPPPPLQPHSHHQHQHQHSPFHHQHRRLHPPAITTASPTIPPASPVASSPPPHPASPVSAATRQPLRPSPVLHHHHASSTLPLRSPPAYHHPYSPSATQISRPSSSSLAAPPGALSSIMASTNGSGAGSGGPLRPPSGSPLQAPRGAGHLSPPAPYHSTTRDSKSLGSFYDPLTDTTRERKTSDSSWSKPVRQHPPALWIIGLGLVSVSKIPSGCPRLQPDASMPLVVLHAHRAGQVCCCPPALWSKGCDEFKVGGRATTSHGSAHPIPLHPHGTATLRHQSPSGTVFHFTLAFLPQALPAIFNAYP